MENFDMNRFFKIFWNSKFYIAFILLLCLAIGYFYSYYYVTPMYQSSATMVLVQNENLEQEIAGDSSITQTDITLNKNLLSTYTKIAKSNKVLEQVIEDLSLDMTPSHLASLVNVQAVNNTQVFKISVSNKDKELAPQITNHLLEVFSNEIRSLYHMNNIYTMDQAEIPNSPYNINHVKDLAIFFMLGLVLSFGLVIVFYLFDTTIKSEKDVEEYADLSVLSSIPMYTKSGKQESELIVNEEPKSPISECFKTFRTNVMFSIQNKKLNTILVTSGFMGEGKSFVSSNLAVAFASSGKKVILVDTDMRKGRVHKIFDLSNERGLSTCLAKIGTDGNNVNINEYIKESRIPNLHVMTSGIVPPNPSELLSSSNMIQLLEALNRQYDIVICDGTPCMLVSDSIILSKIVDSTVIVTANKTTKLDTLLKMKKSIQMVGGNIGGVVINKMEVNTKSYKNSYYYGEHGQMHNASFTPTFEHDIVLDSPLYIKELEQIIIKEPEPQTILDVKEPILSSSKDDLTALSNTIYENTKEISELKGLYKDVMQNTLKIATKEDSSKAILEQLQNMKNSYQDITSKQNGQFENMSAKYDKKMNDIEDKINNIDFSAISNNVIKELQTLKTNYENKLELQKEQINALNEKLDNLSFTDLSDSVLDEISSLKEQYEYSLDITKEQISSLDNKLDNIMQSSNLSDSVLDEISSLKEQYKHSLDITKEQISSLDNKLDNMMQSSNLSDSVLDEISNLKEQYEQAFDITKEQMSSLDNKLDNMMQSSNLSDSVLDEISSLKEQYEQAFDITREQMSYFNQKLDSMMASSDLSNSVLDRLDNLQDEYHDSIDTQNQEIAILNEKIEDLKSISENYEASDKITTQLENMEKNYQVILKLQNEKIDELNQKVNNFKVKDEPSELLEQVLKIYHQLEFMNHKFESLEQRANHNETLIRNLSNEVKNSLYSPSRGLDIDKLNHKVIQIQDYLEKSVRDADTVANLKTGKKNRSVLDGQMNIIDDLLKNAENNKIESEKPYPKNTRQNFIIDYENIKQKQERKGFSLFKNKSANVAQEDEPITIVSQILLNHNESVG